MTEQLNTKPLLKILKNILKYGLKNKNDSKQLLETVNCVLAFGLDSMMKEYVEKGKMDYEVDDDVDDVVYIKKEKKESEVIEIYEDVVVKEEYKGLSLVKNENTQINELKTMIESNQSFMKEQTQIIDRLLHMMNELSKRINQLEDGRNEKPKENITLEIIELEVSEKNVEIKNQIVEEETNQFVKEEEKEEEESEEEESEEEESEEEESEEETEEEEEEEEQEKVEEEPKEQVEKEEEAEEEEEEEEEQEAESEEEEEEEQLKETEDEQHEVKEQEQEQEEEEEEEDEDEEEDEEEEVIEVTINSKTYYTTDNKNGEIYADDNGEVGDKVGQFKNGVAVFFKK